MSTSFDTPEGIDFYRQTVIASGAALYLSTGLRPNRMYTPTRMRDALNEFSGSKAKNLKTALHDYVAWRDTTSLPVTNPRVREAAGL